jgi:hypothetical protein
MPDMRSKLIRFISLIADVVLWVYRVISLAGFPDDIKTSHAWVRRAWDVMKTDLFGWILVAVAFVLVGISLPSSAWDPILALVGAKKNAKQSGTRWWNRRVIFRWPRQHEVQSSRKETAALPKAVEDLFFQQLGSTIDPPKDKPPDAETVPETQRARIEIALEERTEMLFCDQPLSDVIDYLKNRHEIEIQLDQKPLVDAGIGSDTTITRNLKGLALRSALRLALGDLDLSYTIQNGVLLITTKMSADAMVFPRVYQVADLLTADKSLIETITSSVRPDSWKPTGGPGIISELGKTLIVCQSQEAHEDIADLLKLLRRGSSPSAA